MAYPLVTLQMNAMGHVHIWRGDVEPHQVSKYNYHVDGKESELYWQLESDLDYLIDYLTTQEYIDLNNGYPVTTANFPDDYWHQ